MMFNDRRVSLPSIESLTQKYGTNLPGATKKKRSVESWEARASVLAAGRAGSIKATKKAPSKLSQKIAKKMYPAGIPNMPKKGQ